MAEKIVMGYWDCPFCQTKKIKGTLQDCPNCGATRTKDVRFYMDTDHVEYLSGEEAAHKGKGADWMCSWCRSYNSVERTTCKNCGAPKEEQSFDYFERNANGKTPSPDANASSGTQPGHDKSNDAHENASFTKSRLRGLLIAFLLVFGVIGFFSYIIMPKNRNLTVSKVSWQYNIEIEKYREVEENDWYLPEGGTLLRTNEEIHHYDQVLDHYERVERTRQVQDGYDESTYYTDNGDGTYTEHTTRTPRYRTESYYENEPVYVSVPVYRTKYYYTIWRWLHERDVTTSGTDKNPYYGDAILDDNEREGTHTEVYRVTGYFKKKGKEKEYKVTKELWEQLFPDHTYKVKIQSDEIKELL